jgi:hypothetical protein
MTPVARTIINEVTMRNKTVVNILCISAQLFLLLCALLLTCVQPAHGAATAQMQPIVRGPALNLEIIKILPVLELRIENQKLLEKSKEKLYSMNSNEVRLVAALCEKISNERHAVSSDIAFLLVTALLVLS